MRKTMAAADRRYRTRAVRTTVAGPSKSVLQAKQQGDGKKHRRADICCEKKPIQWKELSKPKTGALLQICLVKKKKETQKY